MGLANLVPGISGGTMLLATGVYPAFIESISDLTRFRFRYRSLLTLGCIAAAAGIGILLLAGSLKDLVLDYRWVMYSLFIGLTLGGLPVVWRLAKSTSAALAGGAFAGFMAMVLLALLESRGVMGAGQTNFVMLFVAGLAGASAMILPGVSGGYLLLLLGQYVPILSAVDQFKLAIKARDITAAMEPALSVLVPVGLGVVAGVVIVGNLLKWLLHRYREATLGVLLGLLMGSVVGLWPFKQGVAAEVGKLIKGQIMTPELILTLEKKDWPVELFTPTTTQWMLSAGLIVIGFAVTQGIAMVGRDREGEK
jgi:putative membrane protein